MPPRSPTSKPVSKPQGPDLADPLVHLRFSRSSEKELTWASIDGTLNVEVRQSKLKYYLAPVRLSLRYGREVEDFRTILRILTENQKRIEANFPPLVEDDDPLLR
jgi:hypothetical protein